MKKLAAAIAASLLGISCATDELTPQTCRLGSSTQVSTHGGGTATAAYTYSYYPNGQLSSTTDGDGLVISYQYNTAGQLIKEDRGILTTYFYYNPDGRLTRDSTYFIAVPAPVWNISEYTYNSSGQLVLISTRAESAVCLPACATFTTLEYTYPNTTTKDFASRRYTTGGSTFSETIEYGTDLIREEFRVAWLPVTGTDHFPKRITSDAGNELIYSYQFNSFGNPTTIQVEEQNPTSQTVLTYSYDCF